MLYSPALPHPFEVQSAHQHAVIANVEASVRLSGVNEDLIELKSRLQSAESLCVTVEKEIRMSGVSGANLTYAGYPYDPYA
jgi:hypothetical protein